MLEETARPERARRAGAHSWARSKKTASPPEQQGHGGLQSRDDRGDTGKNHCHRVEDNHGSPHAVTAAIAKPGTTSSSADGSRRVTASPLPRFRVRTTSATFRSQGSSVFQA